jgi:hypothetical protein
VRDGLANHVCNADLNITLRFGSNSFHTKVRHQAADASLWDAALEKARSFRIQQLRAELGFVLG